jgi:hypothetical protein
VSPTNFEDAFYSIVTMYEYTGSRWLEDIAGERSRGEKPSLINSLYKRLSDREARDLLLGLTKGVP